ncbi:uncharacterized protein Dwil_GK20852 [Drosophila willistoni]|uniref:Uncharacterized protein n=1 Tax=Drosophila willistoni TaxID=7260 RepID=B4MJK4_DROWI|nr:uncharacterized protein Dwil_GK20852 [Drosophila willistoni]
MNKLKLMLILMLGICSSLAAPMRTERSPRSLRHDDVQLLHPHIITIERLEHLLRQAGEIFGASPGAGGPGDSDAMASEVNEQWHVLPQGQQQQPQQRLLPPTEQPYNFYLPLFEHIEPKLDAKSRRMEKFAPPPLPSQQPDTHNYYADKPKKQPKKFKAGAKHINLNLKWLNTYEKAMDGVGMAAGPPKAMYLEQDERNRINFDDSFFAVDMQVKPVPDNDDLSGGAYEDDLMAAPAQLAYNYNNKAGKQLT